MTQSSNSGVERKRSLAETVEAAMRFEYNAHRFYGSLKAIMGEAACELAGKLADEKFRNSMLLRDLADSAHARDHHEDMLPIPLSDRRFSGFTQIPVINDQPNCRDLLTFALGRERAAADQYAALAQNMPIGPIRDMFQRLADDEMRHAQELEKLDPNTVRKTSS